ncbi:hypothetical protein GCM10028791_12580 [Echinicola sediminis]
MINSTDATTIGAAALGYLKGNISFGIMTLDGGLGFTVVRNGRRWTPNFSANPLGAVYTPLGTFSKLSNVSSLFGDLEGRLYKDNPDRDNQKKQEEDFLNRLSGIVYTAKLLYQLDEVLLGGRLSELPFVTGNKLEESAHAQLIFLDETNGDKRLNTSILKEGNVLSLMGTILLISSEVSASALTLPDISPELKTEKAYDPTLVLEKMDNLSILEALNHVEQEAGENLNKSLPKLSQVIDETTEKLEKGGRMIYIGCGTSGRLAAVDTVELACTFGFPREKVLTLVAGGIADAAIDIETRFEEDASSIPELLMANVSEKDVLIGISVSGTAYYVQSALAFGKTIGAKTIMIQEHEVHQLPFCDHVLPLNSGSELIAGSTRMKAGTASKKLINFLSTTIMIKLGKVHGTYMTELECLNKKLVKRATGILTSLYGLDETEATTLLENNDLQLNKAIKTIKEKK